MGRIAERVLKFELVFTLAGFIMCVGILYAVAQNDREAATESFAQTIQQQRIIEQQAHEREKIDALTEQVKELKALQVSDRLARLEVSVADMKYLMWITVIGIISLISRQLSDLATHFLKKFAIDRRHEHQEE